MRQPAIIRGIRKANVSLVSERVALAATIIVILLLFTYLFDLWPADVLGIELSVPEALLPLVATLTSLWFVLRRCRKAEKRTHTIERETALAADYSLRIEGNRVFRGTEEILLTPQEFKFLQCLTDNEEQICEYDHIIEKVWPEEAHSAAPPGKENLAPLVRRLRDKITVHDYIKNRPGRGYELVQWER